jgi:hypothetical protein
MQGLLWSNTSRPSIGYGFQDGETKSGAVLYSSVLYWNASRLIAAMATTQGDHALATTMNAQAERIQAAATRLLWNTTAGVFMASTGVESENIDVWGNAAAGATGFASADQSASIFRFFKTRAADIFLEGQVREIPKPTRWSDAKPGSFNPVSLSLFVLPEHYSTHGATQGATPEISRDVQFPTSNTDLPALHIYQRPSIRRRSFAYTRTEDIGRRHCTTCYRSSPNMTGLWRAAC